MESSRSAFLHLRRGEDIAFWCPLSFGLATRCSFSRRSVWAYTATIIVDRLIATAPTLIGRSTPQRTNRPAATTAASSTLPRDCWRPTSSPSRLHLSMVGRVRVRAAGQTALENHPAGCFLLDFLAALHGLSFGDRGLRPDLRNAVTP